MRERDIAVQSLRMVVARGDIGFLRQQNSRRLVEWRGAYGYRSYSHRKRGSLLHVTAWYHRDEIARFLLDNGANINAVDAQEETPLYLAVSLDSVAMVSLLLSRGADVEGHCRCAGSARYQLEETPLSEVLNDFCGDGHSNKKAIEKLVRVISHMEGSSKCKRVVLVVQDLT